MKSKPDEFRIVVDLNGRFSNFVEELDVTFRKDSNESLNLRNNFVKGVVEEAVGVLVETTLREARLAAQSYPSERLLTVYGLESSELKLKYLVQNFALDLWHYFANLKGVDDQDNGGLDYELYLVSYDHYQLVFRGIKKCP